MSPPFSRSFVFEIDTDSVDAYLIKKEVQDIELNRIDGVDLDLVFVDRHRGIDLYKAYSHSARELDEIGCLFSSSRDYSPNVYYSTSTSRNNHGVGIILGTSRQSRHFEHDVVLVSSLCRYLEQYQNEQRDEEEVKCIVETSKHLDELERVVDVMNHHASFLSMEMAVELSGMWNSFLSGYTQVQSDANNIIKMCRRRKEQDDELRH